MKFARLPLLTIALLLGLNGGLAWAQPVQPVNILVVDSRQNPLPGAAVAIEALAGHADEPRADSSDREGRISFTWQPLLEEDDSIDTRDLLAGYITAFNWRISKEGFLPEAGQVEQRQALREIVSEELASLNTAPGEAAPLWRTVVLRRVEELYAPELAGQEQIRKWCLALYEDTYLLARALGAEFTWPGFGMRSNTLIITLNYNDYGWAGAAQAALIDRATINAYLPWCALLARRAGSLPQADEIKLVFISRMGQDKVDPHALSENIVLEGTIPVAALLNAGGDLSRMAGLYPLGIAP